MSGETWAHVKFHWFLQDNTVGTSRIFTSEKLKQWQQQGLRGRTHANRHWSLTDIEDIEDIQCKDSEIPTFSGGALWLWPNHSDLVKCRFYVVPGRVCCWHTSGTPVFKKLRWEESLNCFFQTFHQRRVADPQRLPIAPSNVSSSKLSTPGGKGVHCTDLSDFPRRFPKSSHLETNVFQFNSGFEWKRQKCKLLMPWICITKANSRKVSYPIQ